MQLLLCDSTFLTSSLDTICCKPNLKTLSRLKSKIQNLKGSLLLGPLGFHWNHLLQCVDHRLWRSYLLVLDIPTCLRQYCTLMYTVSRNHCMFDQSAGRREWIVKSLIDDDISHQPQYVHMVLILILPNKKSLHIYRVRNEWWWLLE